jgi:hypothetical protein
VAAPNDKPRRPYAAAVVAHQGGWDEALFVAVPLAVFAVLLMIAKRRAEREAASVPPEPPEPPELRSPAE